jgi:hypothetical protein
VEAPEGEIYPWHGLNLEEPCMLEPQPKLHPLLLAKSGNIENIPLERPTLKHPKPKQPGFALEGEPLDREGE